VERMGCGDIFTLAGVLIEESHDSTFLVRCSRNVSSKRPLIFHLANALSALYPKDSEEKRLLAVLLAKKVEF